MRAWGSVAAGVAVLALIAVPASATIIDNFTDINTLGSVTIPAANAGPANLLETGLSGVLGGSRDIILTRTNLSQAGSISGTVDTVNTRMVFDTQVIDDTADFSVHYDANGAGLAADLTLGGDNAFGLTFGLSTPTSTNVDIYVEDYDSNDTQSFLFSGAGSYSLLYSAFTGIDFTNVKAVRVTVHGVNDGDYRFSFFGTEIANIIPEPATAGLVLLGLTLVGGRRRR